MKEVFGIIYKLINTLNGKVYIGQTIQSLEKRWKQHIRSSRNPKYPINFAVQKYGQENFTTEIVWKCSSLQEMNEKEREYTDLYFGWIDQNGYVLRSGRGKGSMSKETRDRISASKMGEKHPLYGKTLSQEVRNKISLSLQGEKNGHYGHTHSEATKSKLSERRKGTALSDETRKKISIANNGKKRSLETRLKISKSKEKTYIFVSPKDVMTPITNLKKFCKENSLVSSHMFRVYAGKDKQHKGWRKP